MSLERKLLTIFYADVAGYSRLTGDDELGTHRRVMAVLDGATETIRDANGAVLRYSGDAILASFQSVVKAFEAAVDIQREISESNRITNDREPILLRIGINLGEVLEDRGEVFGDGVNLAARLESAAPPGGICVSALVYGQLAGKVDVEFVDGGEIEFRNIREPTRVYYWSLDGLAAASPAVRRGRSTRQKPSIAVLPMMSMNDDVEQVQFANGLTEDLVTALSRKEWYDVAARNSTVTHPGQPVDVRELGRNLGVDFVLEGSVRRSGSRVRVTVQLINSRSGKHEWADKLDRDFEDVFSLQDEITHRVSAILGERIWQSVVREIDELDEADYGPFEWSYSALGLIHEFNPASNRLAIERLRKALAIDAEIPVVNLGLGFCHLIDWGFIGDSEGDSLTKALQYAESCQRLSPNDAHTYRLFSRIYSGMLRFDEARRCVERALSIDSDDSDLVLNKGIFLQQTGRVDEALACFDEVLGNHDETPFTVDITRAWKGLALQVVDDYRAAVSVLQEINGLQYVKGLFLASAYAGLEDDERAGAEIAQVLQACPTLRASRLGLCQSYQDSKVGDRLRNNLVRAGLPSG